MGIDVAKEKHHPFFGTATGKTRLRRLVFEKDLEGLRRLKEEIKEVSDEMQLICLRFEVCPFLPSSSSAKFMCSNSGAEKTLLHSFKL